MINLQLHSLFRKVSVELNKIIVSYPNQMYSYRAYLQTLLRYSNKRQETRLLSEGWVRDTANQMAVTAANGDKRGLAVGATMFSESKTVELVGRPYVDVFQHDRLIPPGVDLHMKLVQAANNFVCKSIDPDKQAQENIKVKFCTRRSLFTRSS